MATIGQKQINLNRIKMVKRDAGKRAALKAIIRNKEIGGEERFKAVMKLAEMPRNGAKIRVRNRCNITGRSRGYHRKLGISRIMLREMASSGLIPGMTKASW